MSALPLLIRYNQHSVCSSELIHKVDLRRLDIFSRNFDCCLLRCMLFGGTELVPRLASDCRRACVVLYFSCSRLCGWWRVPLHSFTHHCCVQPSIRRNVFSNDLH